MFINRVNYFSEVNLIIVKLKHKTMRTNKEIADKLIDTRKQIELISKRMEQEQSHAKYSENIEDYTLHDRMTGLVAEKLILQWVLKMNYK